MNKTKLMLALSLFATTAQADLVVYDDLNDSASAFSVVKDASGVDQLTLWTCPKMKTINSIADCNSPAAIMPMEQIPFLVKATVLNWGLNGFPTELKPLPHQDVQDYYEADFNSHDKATQNQLKDLKTLQDYLVQVQAMRKTLPNSDAYKQKEADTLASIKEATRLSSKVLVTNNSAQKAERSINDLAGSFANFLRMNKLQDESKPQSATNTVTTTPNSYARSQMVGTLMDAVVSRVFEYSSKGKVFFANGDLKALVNDGSYLRIYEGKDNPDQIMYSVANPILLIMGNEVYVIALNGYDAIEFYNYSQHANSKLKMKRKTKSIVSFTVTGTTGYIRIQREDGGLWDATFDVSSVRGDYYNPAKMDWQEVPAAPAGT